MEEDRDKVEELMGVIGASGRARGFEEQADYERRASYVWRALSVLALVGLVVAAWWLAQETVGDAAVDWYAFGGKFTLLGAIGVLAGYAINQGRGHLRRAESNRKLQLELTSIRPFLAGFPEDEEREILREFAPRWFGNVPTESPADDDTIVEELRRMAEDGITRGRVAEEESEG